jgi:hypothetical protein
MPVERNAPSRRRACVFCGAEGVSKEHLWSDWIRGMLTDPSEATAHTRNSARTAQEWKAPPFTAVVRCVCARCNQGWMSDIETEVKPHLQPMIQGRQRILGTKAQTALAKWVFLKVLMFDQWRNDDSRIVSSEHYRDFYAGKRPPLHTRVMTAAYEGGTSIGRYNDVSLDLTPPGGAEELQGVNAYLATMTIHHAVLQVFGHQYREELDLTRPPNLAAAVTRIWPIRQPVAWPPNRTILNHEWLLRFESARDTGARPDAWNAPLN